MASALLASCCKTWLPWQDSSFSASNHTQINPSGYILGGVLYWTFSGCKSTNKTTTKTPESAFHRNGRRLLEEKQLKHIETTEKKPMDEQSEKNVAKVWLSSIKLACHALLWINGHGHRDSVPSLHTTSLSVNSNSSYHRDRKLTNVLEGDALHLLLIWGETNNSRCWLSNWPKTLNVWKLLTGRLVNTQLLILMACKMSWRLKMSLPFLSLHWVNTAARSCQFSRPFKIHLKCHIASPVPENWRVFAVSCLCPAAWIRSAKKQTPLIASELHFGKRLPKT